MVKITEVEKGSYAETVGIKSGDILLSVNENVIKDVLDYRFYIMEPKLVVEIERNGQKMTFTIKKDEYDDIGLEFSTYLMDEKRSCRNGGSVFVKFFAFSATPPSCIERGQGRTAR